MERLAALLAERDGSQHAERDVEERERFVGSLAGGPPSRHAGFRSHRRSFDRRLLVAVAAVAFGVGAMAVRWSDPAPAPVVSAPAPMAYSIEGGHLDGGTLRSEAGGATVRFDDGSAFEVEGGNLTVGPVSHEAATLVLERGRLHATVTPRQGHRWVVAAGPYTVSVTGTAFSVDWTPGEALSIELRRGSVTVRGPLIADGLALEPGQRLHADVREEELRVGPLAPPREASSTTSPPPSATGADPTPPPRPVSWAERVAAGDYAVVLAEAEALGIGAVLASGSAGRLVALGDAARYEGRPDIARKCLHALRERFPASPAGQSAAFLLGRMSEGSPATAIGWYDRYLAEAPGGAYAAQALGRKLALLARSNRSAAQPVARQYLQLYPQGAYADLARSLL